LKAATGNAVDDEAEWKTTSTRQRRNSNTIRVEKPAKPWQNPPEGRNGGPAATQKARENQANKTKNTGTDEVVKKLLASSVLKELIQEAVMEAMKNRQVQETMITAIEGAILPRLVQSVAKLQGKSKEEATKVLSEINDTQLEPEETDEVSSIPSEKQIEEDRKLAEKLTKEENAAKETEKKKEEDWKIAKKSTKRTRESPSSSKDSKSTPSPSATRTASRMRVGSTSKEKEEPKGGRTSYLGGLFQIGPIMEETNNEDDNEDEIADEEMSEGSEENDEQSFVTQLVSQFSTPKREGKPRYGPARNTPTRRSPSQITDKVYMITTKDKVTPSPLQGDFSPEQGASTSPNNVAEGSSGNN
jgi:hypothetical protein